MQNETMRIYWRASDMMERAYASLEEHTLSKKNITLLCQFGKNLESRGCGAIRVDKCLRNARIMAQMMSKDLNTVTREDIESYLAAVARRNGWSPSTKNDYKRIARQFFRWYIDYFDILDPKLIKAIRSIKITQKREQPETTSVLEDEDIEKMLRKAHNDKERAFISVLFEGGFRIGEHLGLRIKNVKFEGKKCSLEVDGKTGRRRVTLYVSAGVLGRWLSVHPFGNNPEAYVWLSENVNFCRRNVLPSDGMRYYGAVRLIRRIAKASGINKRFNCHWFRHSRATLNSEILMENELDQFMGWVPGSRQAATYVHVKQSTVENKLDVFYGVKPASSVQKPIPCVTCGTINRLHSRYCSDCGRPMSTEIGMVDDKKFTAETNDALSLMMQMLKDPEMMRRFEAFKASQSSR